MKLSPHSKNRFMNDLASYDVPESYANVIYSYLVYGFNPGHFFYSVFANDCFSAISHSHPGNSVNGLKLLVCWIVNSHLMDIAFGNYKVVDNWMKLDHNTRRKYLEHVGLIYPESDELIMILNDVKLEQPFFNN